MKVRYDEIHQIVKEKTKLWISNLWDRYHRQSKNESMIEKFNRSREIQKYISHQSRLRNEYVWFNSLDSAKRIEYLRDHKVKLFFKVNFIFYHIIRF